MPTAFSPMFIPAVLHSLSGTLTWKLSFLPSSHLFHSHHFSFSPLPPSVFTLLVLHGDHATS